MWKLSIRICQIVNATREYMNTDADRVIRVGHSPDPDDAFMFNALTTGIIQTPGSVSYTHLTLTTIYYV